MTLYLIMCSPLDWSWIYKLHTEVDCPSILLISLKERFVLWFISFPGGCWLNRHLKKCLETGTEKTKLRCVYISSPLRRTPPLDVTMSIKCAAVLVTYISSVSQCCTAPQTDFTGHCGVREQYINTVAMLITA